MHYEEVHALLCSMSTQFSFPPIKQYICSLLHTSCVHHAWHEGYSANYTYIMITSEIISFDIVVLWMIYLI